MNRRDLMAGLAATTGLLATQSGCTSFRTRQAQRPGGNAELTRPMVAVADFENRASFQGQWALGSGFADLLVAELLRTGNFVVLDRKHLNDVLRELQLQQNDAFRKEGQVPGGRLKNARYLIRGTITDFTVVGDVSGWFGANKGRKGGGAAAGGRTARVAVVLKVVDVETAEILTTLETYGKAGAGWFSAAVNYSGLSFGGDAFFRTPLGDATSESLRKAARKIRTALPRTPWDPRVASVEDNGRVLINGGANVGLGAGTRLRVRSPGRVITDPVTGNVLHREPGPVVGMLEVTEVLDEAAWARVLSGAPQRGLRLEADAPQPASRR